MWADILNDANGFIAASRRLLGGYWFLTPGSRWVVFKRILTDRGASSPSNRDFSERESQLLQLYITMQHLPSSFELTRQVRHYGNSVLCTEAVQEVVFVYPCM